MLTNIHQNEYTLLLPEFAKLMYLSHKKYYDLFSNPKESITKAISDDRSEESTCQAFFINDTLLGQACFYDSNEIKIRQLFSLKFLNQHTQIENSTLKVFAREVPSINKHSLYISRLSIQEESQKQGFAKQILDYIENKAQKLEYSLLSLHVDKDNSAAIKLYRKCGFAINNDKSNYFTMYKKLTKETICT